MTDLVVRELKQAEWDGWDQWLALQPWGSPFSTSWWLDANCRAFGGHPLLLGVLDGEQLVGGVSLRIMDTGPLHVVRPSMLYNPIVIGAGSAQRRQQILAALLEDMAHRKLVVRLLNCTPDMVDLREAVWHHWNLTAAWTVLQSLKTWTLGKDVAPAELRQLRKAQRAGVTAGVEPPDADILYDLVHASMSRRQQPVGVTREQLHTLVEAAGTHGIQIVARDVDGVPLSVTLIMVHGTCAAYCLWIGTSAIGLTKGATVAMYISTLEQLQTRGYGYLDWCGGSLPGLSDFKLKFGGILTTRLAVSREPQWLKGTYPVYVRLLQLRHIVKKN